MIASSLSLGQARDGALGGAPLPVKGDEVAASPAESGSPFREAAGARRAVRAAPAPRRDARASDRELVDQLGKSEIFQDYQRAFAATVGMPLAIQRSDTAAWPVLDGREACGGLNAAPGRRCAGCIRLRRWVDEGASGEVMTVRCCTGFSESAVPLRLGVRVFGFLRTGGGSWLALSRKRFTEFVRKARARPTSREVATLRAAYFARCAVARDRHESALRLVVLFARHLSLLGNQMMIAGMAGESPRIARARSFIAEHHGEELSLVHVAQAVHMSPYYFCKVFKEATGETFTHHLARVRIEQVKQSLLQRHLRISEAAFAAGFQSLSQFNRSFRSFAGETPSAYRERWCDASGENLPEQASRVALRMSAAPL